MNLFFDTNALIKLYHKENGSKNLTSFLDKHSNENLILTISHLSKIEFYSAILKSVRTKEISSEISSEIFEIFEKDLKYFVQIEIGFEVKELAVELLQNIATKNELKTLDSIQLATAFFTNQIIQLDYFITSDKTLEKITQKYFKVINLETDDFKYF